MLSSLLWDNDVPNSHIYRKEFSKNWRANKWLLEQTLIRLLDVGLDMDRFSLAGAAQNQNYGIITGLILLYLQKYMDIHQILVLEFVVLGLGVKIYDNQS